MVTSGVAAVLHPVINYVMIEPMRLGYLGAAVSNTVTQILWLAMLVGYVVVLDLPRKVDLRLSKELVRSSFRQIMPFMRVRRLGLLPKLLGINALLDSSSKSSQALSPHVFCRVFLQLALPGMLMIGEWWASESIILLGGMLEKPSVMVSTLSIYQTVNAVAYMVDYGVHVAANTRVGNELGR
jgi:Na+-driven multidrug efflux pump